MKTEKDVMKLITKEQKFQLKEELLEQKQQWELTFNEEGFINKNTRDSVGELSLYANHPGDLGTDFYEREKDLALAVHAKDEYRKVLHALEAMEKGTYGQCEVCGTSIPYERLEVLPSTTFCKEHSPDQKRAEDRPVEEQLIEPAHTNSFSYRLKSPIKDYEDIFEEVAKYGTSETPSDFLGNYTHYNQLYRDESKDGTQELYENFSVTDISGTHQYTLEVPEKDEYMEMLDEIGMESQIGNIPYYVGNSYLKDEES